MTCVKYLAATATKVYRDVITSQSLPLVQEVQPDVNITADVLDIRSHIVLRRQTFFESINVLHRTSA